MKPPTDPELASFVAKLIGFEFKDGWWIWPEPYTGLIKDLNTKSPYDSFFIDMAYAPIIRHLIEEEMKHRKWRWSADMGDYFIDRTSGPTELAYHYTFYKLNKIGTDINANETRAVALAAYRTGER